MEDDGKEMLEKEYQKKEKEMETDLWRDRQMWRLGIGRYQSAL